MSKINGSADVYRLVSEPLKNEIQEKVLLVTLNNANEVKGVHLMAIGSDTAVLFPIKLIARQALMDVACGVIVVHNHPSGNVLPSSEDIKQTERLKRALNVFDISLLDHVIVSEGKYYSFAEEEEHSI